MIAEGEDELICDLAETYNIYDYKSLPVNLVATFSVGLREESRIYQKILDLSHFSWNERLLSIIYDKLSLLYWGLTEDGRQGINRPNSIYKILFNSETEKKDVTSFETGEEFERARRRIINGNNS